MKEEKIIRRTVYMRGRPMYGVFATSTFAMYRDESECGKWNYIELRRRNPEGAIQGLRSEVEDWIMNKPLAVVLKHHDIKVVSSSYWGRVELDENGKIIEMASHFNTPH